MENDTKLLQYVKKLMISRYPRFGAQIASVKLEYNTDLKYHTASTDGETIFFDPNYLESLSDGEKLFIFAHELMHIKFEHIDRLFKKDGQMRDLKLWNTATDAIINANLERDGFKIKEGYVNMPEALNYNAEEFYEILLEKNKNRQGKGQQENEDQENRDQQFADDHTSWGDDFKKRKEREAEQKRNSEQIGKTNQGSKDEIFDPFEQSSSFKYKEIDEKAQFQENRMERRQRAIRNMERMREQELRKSENKFIEFGDVGEAKPVLDWRFFLRKEVEKTEIVWSQRRAIAENNFAYRLEENDVENQAETEVMLDVSGSVSLEMIKTFLKQLKPILKESKLKVGCFNEKFWGMVEIKSNKDIDNFKIPTLARGHASWTEDWDLAVRSFSKKKEVNKIVFTDGEPCPGVMPRNDLKETNVIWIVYKNRNFNPCCGKVININSRDLHNMISAGKTLSGTEL